MKSLSKINSIFMKSNFIRIFLFSWIFLTGFTVFSQDGIPDKPQPERLVNDYANILSPAEVNALEQKLVHFNDSTSTQIVVVIVNDLGGRDETDFADRLGEKWGVGQKGKNNGIVILIKPTGGQGQRKARISVGYGLEGVIPDATAHRIVDKEMIPYFKKNQFYEGIDAAINILISLSKGEFTADQYNKSASKKNTFVTLIPLFIVIFIFILLIRNNKRKGPMSPGKSLPFWMLLGMMGSGRSSSGSWGGFSGGGSGGGGFGGFGGGSFGGGGSSGSW
jgi:uncharacterized protein